jgi:acyl-CoA synthetase (AMP-forming)/AMP-acid ligase II
MAQEFNIGLTHEAVSSVAGEREALVWRDRRLTYADLTDRSRRLATYLRQAGLGVRRERPALANYESGQDHVGLYLRNGNEYVEGMLGAFKARCAPVNVNYRYVAGELRYLFADADVRGLIYHAAFAPTLSQVRESLPGRPVLLQVDDGSGEPLLPGAVDYEEALASVPAGLPDIGQSPDDLYVLYTGGTTGMPKGVLWRQHDIFMSAMGGRIPGVWDPVTSYDEVRERVLARAGAVDTMVMIPPLMHGAAQWATSIMMHLGARVVIPDENRRADPADILRTVQRERASMITVVGNAVMRPLLEEMTTGRYDLSSLAVIGNGGARLTAELKERVLAFLPGLFISDSMGASETGAQGSHLSARGSVSTGTFSAGPGAVVLTEGLDALHEPGHDGIGWLGQSGWIPLGYLGNREKTERTFPVIGPVTGPVTGPVMGAVRYAVPGDRARLLSNGDIDVLGRDSVTINTGGEKVFVEEVEEAIASHPAVLDVIVCGRPSERWGSEIVAIIQLAAGGQGSEAELRTHLAHRLARYKLPKCWVFVNEVQRSPSGKADYRWARSVAEKASAPGVAPPGPTAIT